MDVGQPRMCCQNGGEQGPEASPVKRTSREQNFGLWYVVVLTGLGTVLPESEVDTVEVALHAGGSANL